MGIVPENQDRWVAHAGNIAIFYGECKMGQTLPKAYEPAEIESKWEAYWQESRTFTPDVQAAGEPFSIVIPPPNVTGALHIGHALNLSLIDVLCRHARQLGKNVLWIPGTDHAGISTQNVVERSLAKDGVMREEMGREAFIEKIWEWRANFGDKILKQIAALGCSVDWSRLRFTMDEGLSRAVRKVFVTLYNEGLIYKGDYLINWCPHCKTALADDEVEHADEPGKLWDIDYRLADGGALTIATTRPETIPGDTAICVNPHDDRYSQHIGKKAFVPIIGREIPIIADNYVKQDFGTGCLKVTPAHDVNDWKLGEKHNLEIVQVIDEENRMMASAGKYAGMPAMEAREAILADLESCGQLKGVEELRHAVGRCYRCHTVVEPLVSRQWFVEAKKLAPAARQAVPELTRILPENWLNTYYEWLDNIRDWCISRQIWWGHRIPAWTCQACGKVNVSEEDLTVCPVCGSAAIVQEEDVLDTWFSSALWPFSTLGWPDLTPELKLWYPTTTLVTGHDILFFWVARMMMMGIHFLGEPPFRVVYLHALVRDAQGQKMSKSKGNGIDPVEMIAKFGCDALRFTLVSMAAMGRDIRLSESKIESSRHFVNKLWNAARFVLMNLDGAQPRPVALGRVDDLAQIWILDHLESVKLEMAEALAQYRFNDATMSAYKFLWNDFCDWFLELSKPALQAQDEETRDPARYVLWVVLKEILQLVYPVMPFVTAEIWQALPGCGEDIATVPYPPARPECSRPVQTREMEFIKNVISAARTIKAELGINPNQKVILYLHPATMAQKELLESHRSYIILLARTENLIIDMQAQAPEASAAQVVEGCQVILPLAGNINIEDELGRLDKEIGKLEKELVEVQKKLRNEGFVSRAPEEVVAREQQRADRLLDAREKLVARRAIFHKAGTNADV